MSLPVAWVAALLFLVVGAPAAMAAPGDNGDVKIHAAATPVGDERDETHVCVFYLDAFGFDTVQHVSWTISQLPPTGTATVASGKITLHDGTGSTTDMSLPAGHYRLTWTFKNEHGSAKHKDFFSDCAAPSPSPSVQGCPECPSPSPSASSSTLPSTGTSGSASPGTGGSKGGSPGSGAGPGGGKLAQTGFSLLPLAGSAAALLLSGTVLTRRSRKSAHTR